MLLRWGAVALGTTSAMLDVFSRMLAYLFITPSALHLWLNYEVRRIYRMLMKISLAVISKAPAKLSKIIVLQVKPEEVEVIRRDYTANGGWETFLSYEDPRQDILVGLLRLRRVSGSLSQPRPGAAEATAGACCGGTDCTSSQQASVQPASSRCTTREHGSSGTAEPPSQPATSAQRGSTSPAVDPAALQTDIPRIRGSAASSAEQTRRPAAAHGGRGVGSGAETQPELRGRCSIVRELHVYGTAVAVHARDSQHQQHQVRCFCCLTCFGPA